jgi:hypothetical protein
LAALQRSPLRCVTWKVPKPSCSAPLKSGLTGWPASTPARTKASRQRAGLRSSATFSGPPLPCHASAPRSLCSARLKKGSTSS